ncbi:MAG: hypothetical protein ACRCXA_11125 [Peptostreptococcaceae bacterium]
MKKTKKLLNLTLTLFLILGFNASNIMALDFTSNQIIVKNDAVATQVKLYPVLIVENTTDTELDVTYTFYINNDDASSFTDKVLSIKAHSKIVLEIPELHHLGDTKEQRSIWFSWNNANIRKPLQTQIETSIFKNPEKSNDKHPNIEFGSTVE